MTNIEKKSLIIERIAAGIQYYFLSNNLTVSGKQKTKVLKNICEAVTKRSIKSIPYDSVSNRLNIPQEILPSEFNETFLNPTTHQINPNCVKMTTKDLFIGLMAFLILKKVWAVLNIQINQAFSNENSNSENEPKHVEQNEPSNKNSENATDSQEVDAKAPENGQKSGDGNEKVNYSKKPGSNPDKNDPDKNDDEDPEDPEDHLGFNLFTLSLFCELYNNMCNLFITVCLYLGAVDLILTGAPYLIRPVVRFFKKIFSPNERELYELLPKYKKILDSLTDSIGQKTPILYVTPKGFSLKPRKKFGRPMKIGDLIREQAKSPVGRNTIENRSLRNFDRLKTWIFILSEMLKTLIEIYDKKNKNK